MVMARNANFTSIFKFSIFSVFSVLSDLTFYNIHFISSYLMYLFYYETGHINTIKIQVYLLPRRLMYIQFFSSFLFCNLADQSPSAVTGVTVT